MSGTSPTGTPLEFPEEEVRPGFTWTVPLEKSMAKGGLVQVEQRLDITYRFESMELRNGERYAVLSFSGPMETAMVPDSTAPMAMDMSLQGEMKGELEFDIDAGRAGATTVITSVSGLMSMMGQDINMSMTMKMETTPLPLIPNSVRILFQSRRTGAWDFFSMKADGSDVVKLAENPLEGGFPSCSFDGSKIAFDARRDGNRDIYTMSPDGSNQIRLTDYPGIDANPAWSPDGSKILFETNRDGKNEVYVMNADGSGKRDLSKHLSHDSHPVWSADKDRQFKGPMSA